jgi:hypothetical protein
MEKLRQPKRPHLFVLKLWLEELGDGKTEWRGVIQAMSTREKRYFREWQTLLDFLQHSCEAAQLQAAPADNFQLSNNPNPSSE